MTDSIPNERKPLVRHFQQVSDTICRSFFCRPGLLPVINTSLFIVCACALTAGEAPFGSEAFTPTPESAVGFAGQGSSWYPGATPPTEWWEGTPTKVKVACEMKIRRDGYKSLAGPYDKERELVGYADDKAKNILWKMPVPGWSAAQPVAIGKRVITLHSPHHVVCWDADTGKILWQDALKVMTLPKIAADRKSLEQPGPQAENLQLVHEVGLAVFRLSCACQPGLHKGILDLEDRKALVPLYNEFIAGLEGLKKTLGTAVPDSVPAINAQIDELKKGLVANATSIEEVVKFRLGAFTTWSQKLTGIYVGNGWPGWQIGDTIASPVSDGTILVAAFGHGQVAAYNLADGKRLWALRDPTVNAGSVSHSPSPLIWKDLVILNAGAGPKGQPTILALDAKTGTVRWESAAGKGGCRMGGSHGDHMPHYLMRLAVGGGKVRALIVTNQGAVLDAETGATLVEKLAGSTEKNQGLWGSGFLTSIGDVVFKTYGGDCSPPPCESWQIKTTGTGIEAVVRPLLSFSNSHAPFALSDQVLVLRGKNGISLINPADGQVLSNIQASGNATIAGKTLIFANELVNTNGRERKDRMCLCSFTTVDISDPTKPRVISDKSLLGSAAMPADIADMYFPAIAKNADLKALTLGGYHGVAPGFGVYMAGVTAHGSRLYIQSQSHLYAIGER